MNKIKSYIVYFILLTAFARAETQDHSFLISQYMYNGLAINPAFAGVNEVFTTSASYRNQWMGFEGAPINQSLSAHAPLKKTNLALGIFFNHEKIGSRNYSTFFFNYAYRLVMNKNKLAFGLRVGAISGKLSPIELGEGEFLFGDHYQNYFLPNFGFGMAYYNSDYYIGLSIPFMLGYKSSGSDALQSYHDFNYYSYYLLGYYTFKLIDQWTFQPSLLINYEKSLKFSETINLKTTYKNTLTFGLGYRNGDALLILFDYRFNYQLKTGIAYDFGIGEISNYNNGSMEISLQYEFGYKINVANPADF